MNFKVEVITWAAQYLHDACQKAPVAHRKPHIAYKESLVARKGTLQFGLVFGVLFCIPFVPCHAQVSLAALRKHSRSSVLQRLSNPLSMSADQFCVHDRVQVCTEA